MRGSEPDDHFNLLWNNANEEFIPSLYDIEDESFIMQAEYDGIYYQNGI